MALKVNDVITEDFVRDTVEEFVEEDLVYRDVFNQISATGIQSNAYRFHVAQDDMGNPQYIPEGAEFPRDQSSVEPVTVTFEKYGDEVSMTMEAQEDGMIDMKAREIEDLARAMDEHLDDKAFNHLNDNVKTTVGDGNDTMTFSDVKEGMVEVRRGNYSPDTLILDLDAYGDLLVDDSFNRATSAGDNVVDTGDIGQVVGMDVVVDNTHDIGGDGNGGAFVVDSNKFGYELTRTPISTNEYTDPERQADIMQIYTRKAWAPIWTDAAVKVDA